MDNVETELSEKELVLWADSLEKEAKKKKNPIKTKKVPGKNNYWDDKSPLTQAIMRSWAHTNNFEFFISGFGFAWVNGGVGAPVQTICNSTVSQVMKQNIGKSFWEGNNLLKGEEDYVNFSADRFTKNIKKLKRYTENFYKSKLQTKLKVKRGVADKVDEYLPAPCESWTTDDDTARNFSYSDFADMSEESDEGGTILESDITYNDILMSYESMKDIPGWPPDEDAALVGKKEVVVLGGGLRKITTNYKNKNKKNNQ